MVREELMTASLERVSGVIDEIYAAVGKPEGFAPVVCSIRRLINGASGILFTPMCGLTDGGFGYVDHFDVEFYARYREYYRDQDPWVREARRKGLIHTGMAVTNDMLMSDDEFRKESFYYEAHVPMDAIRLCSGVVMGGGDPTLPLTYLSIYRGVGSTPFSPDDLKVLELLLPHVRQALRLARRLSAVEASAEASHRMLHAVGCGVVALDAKACVVFVNDAAERLCTGERGLEIRAGRSKGECVLIAVSPRENVIVQQAIGEALTGIVTATPASAAPIVVRGERGTGTTLLTVMPFSARVNGLAGEARALVLIEDPCEAQAGEGALFKALFGLTPSECRVALGLASGEQPKVLADDLGVTENTVRAHIKAIHAKTATRGMVSLVALLSRVLGARASRPRGEPPTTA